VLRGQLARRVLLDAHALDDDSSVTTLVLGAAAYLATGQSAAHHVDARAARAARWRRSTWSSVGVEVGELSAPVLTLGLPGDGTSHTDRVLTEWRSAGEPVHLTVRQLLSHPPHWESLAGADVFICENPSVVSVAADTLRSPVSPLVCTHGQPSAAVAAALDRLAEAGANLRYHGDFDWGGLRIAARVLSEWPVTPWRFGTTDYLDAVHAGLGGRDLRAHSPSPSPWDPALSETMSLVGRAVEEEAVVDQLVADLRSSSG
jgi:uncharacterized protein (TIGR02679 family)